MPSPLTSQRPHNADAEQSLIGAILIDPDRFIDVAATVRAEDFHEPVYRAIFEAVCRLHEARVPADFVTVGNELRNDERLQRLGGAAFLATLTQNVPTASHAEHYAGIVHEKALQRRLIELGEDIVTIATDAHIPALDALARADQHPLHPRPHPTSNPPHHTPPP